MLTMTASLLTFLIVAATAAPAPAADGRLCLSDLKVSVTEGTCRKVSGSTFEVEPAANPRHFLWLSPDGKTVQIGTVPSDATTVDLQSKDEREVKLQLRGDPTRGWPAGTELLVSRKEMQWRFNLSEAEAVRMERLIVPAGQYALEARTEHHRPIRARIDVTTAGQDLSRVRFAPLPRVHGKVVDTEAKPIGYATVALPDGSLCTTSDEQGAFLCELPERSPHLVVIHASGYGSRELKVDSTRNYIDLGTIRMSKGLVLSVKISADDPDSKPVKATLLSDLPEEYEHTLLKTAALEPGQDQIRYENLSAGRYILLLAGTEALERLTTAIEIAESQENAAVVKIEPFQLKGRFLFGDEPVRRGKLEVIGPDHAWREQLAVAADGSFGGTMWQRGSLTALAHAEANMSELVHSPALGTDPSTWEIRIRNRAIIGKVIDASSKTPVAGARIGLMANFDRSEDGGGGNLHSSVSVAPDSSFRILASRSGKYQLTTTAPGYTPKVMEITVGADDADKSVDVAMDRGVERVLEIVTSSGAPIPEAMVMEGVRDEVNPQVIQKAGADGKYNLRGLPGETRLLYIIPPAGSFAVARVQMHREGQPAEPLRVVIPPVAGEIHVRAIDPDDQPAPARILLRYNGEFVPPAILRFVTSGILSTNRSGDGVLARLPAGAYELWAVGSLADEQLVIASHGSVRPAARVGLSAGPSSVTVAAPKREVRPSGNP